MRTLGNCCYLIAGASHYEVLNLIYQQDLSHVQILAYCHSVPDDVQLYRD